MEKWNNGKVRSTAIIFNHLFKSDFETILAQVPGALFIKEPKALASYYLWANPFSAKLMGYNNNDQLIGTSDFELKNEAVKFADKFHKDDKEILQGNTKLLINSFNYPYQGIQGLIVSKQALRDQHHNIIGVICHGLPITTQQRNALLAGACLEGGYQSASTVYEVKKTLGPEQLTRKQLECYYYLLRGKSYKEIASLMKRSPRTIEKHIEQIKSKMKNPAAELRGI